METGKPKRRQDGDEKRDDPVLHVGDYPVRSGGGTSLRFWVITIAAVLAMALTGALGRWQLGRAATKEQMALRLQQQSQLPVASLQAVMAQMRPAQGRAAIDGLDRRVMVTGTWLPQYTVLLDNRPMSGKTGFYVLTPLLDTDSGQAVLVQRGWLPRDFQDRERIAPFSTAAGPQRVLGRVARTASHTLALQADVPPAASSKVMIRQNLDLAAYRTETGLPLWDHVLVQTDGAPDGLVRDWPVPDQGVDKHYGYAFQWFGLCALIASLYVWFQLVPRFRSRPAAAG